jgi:hypothetical protein
MGVSGQRHAPATLYSQGKDPWPRFTPGERIHGTHWTGGWVGSRASLDLKARGKIILHRPGIKPESPGRPVGSQPP